MCFLNGKFNAFLACAGWKPDPSPEFELHLVDENQAGSTLEKEILRDLKYSLIAYLLLQHGRRQRGGGPNQHLS